VGSGRERVDDINSGSGWCRFVDMLSAVVHCWFNIYGRLLLAV
jgi:hypothetical protein